ncbi:MAG: hypothetical protein ACP5E6_15255, partial [Acidiphilium sp.]
MWAPTTRAPHSHTGLRGGSDVTDAEWLIISPFLSPPSSCSCLRKWETREIILILFVALHNFLLTDPPPRPRRDDRGKGARGR